MKTLTLLILGTILFSAIIVAIPTSTSSFILTKYSWVKKPSYPGDIGILELNIVQVVGHELVGVKISLTPYSNYTVPVSDNVMLSKWGSGEEARLRFTIIVYRLGFEETFKLAISWGRTLIQGVSGLETHPGGADALIFSLRIEGDPLINVEVKPSQLTQGGITKISFKVRNIGYGRAIATRVRLEARGLIFPGRNTPFTILNIGDLSFNQSFETKIGVIPIVDNPTIDVSVEYATVSGEYIREKITVPLIVRKWGIIYLVLEPSLLQVGSTHSVKMRVVNGADRTIRNLIIKLSPEPTSQVIIPSQIYEVDEVPPGEIVDIPLEIIVPLSAGGLQIIRYEIAYTTSEGEVVKESGTTYLNIISPAKINIIGLEVVPSQPKVNETIIVSTLLINTGATPANNINATIILPKNIKFVRKKTLFIGRLDPQTPTSLAFSLIPESPGTYELRLKITYLDIYGREHTVTKKLSINVEEQKQQVGISTKPMPEITYVAVISLAIVVGVIIYLLRKHGIKK